MVRRGFWGLLLLAGLLMGWGLLPARAEPAVNVKVDNYVINFPNEVVFSLEAEAPFEITKITLNFRAGSTLATRYGYPEFAPGTQVKATYRLRTSGGENNQNYLPPVYDHPVLVRFRGPQWGASADRGENFSLPGHPLRLEDLRERPRNGVLLRGGRADGPGSPGYRPPDPEQNGAGSWHQPGATG